MPLLLDTHALIWWLTDDVRLGRRAYDAVTDRATVAFVSAATAWEIATKYRIGKLEIAGELSSDYAGVLRREGFQQIDITTDHAWRAGSLPGTHRDPFDRLLIAQAQAEDLTVVSADTVFDAYGVRRIW